MSAAHLARPPFLSKVYTKTPAARHSLFSGSRNSLSRYLHRK